METLHSSRFPGESREYRAARDELLRAEIELRRRVEEVAALRRRLPAGGEIPQDYAFEEVAADLADDAPARTVRLSELFSGDADTLVVYSFMFGPRMARPCPSCTSILDSLNGTAPHAEQRISLVVSARSPIERVRAFARERGWKNLRLVSSHASTYNADYHAEAADGDQLPVLNVFARRAGRIHHSWASELMFVPRQEGQDPRHVDSIWPLWNLFDLTPEGRGTSWWPQLSYPAARSVA